MNQSLISSYVEYLRKIGYSAQTIHAYSKALEQAPDTWNTNVPSELYEHINNTLNLKQEYFLPAARHNIKPASSLLFMFVTGVSFKAYTKQEIQNKSAYAGVLKEFYVYSTEFKHMTIMAAEAETHHISEFLNSIGYSQDNWTEITAEDIRDYVCVRRHILVSINCTFSYPSNEKQRQNRISNADSCRCFFTFLYQVNDWLLAADRMISEVMLC